MPVKTPQDSLKATSPSKLIQNNIDNSWGAQQGTTDPKQALKQKKTSNPFPVKGGGK